MSMINKLPIMLLCLLALLLLAMTPMATAEGHDCVIPASGPWPPCATGGGNHTPSNDYNSPAGQNCVIPPSGPWPACARNGGRPATTPVNTCIIPPSGPWPTCATGGGGAAQPSAESAPMVMWFRVSHDRARVGDSFSIQYDIANGDNRQVRLVALDSARPTHANQPEGVLSRTHHASLVFPFTAECSLYGGQTVTYQLQWRNSQGKWQLLQEHVVEVIKSDHQWFAPDLFTTIAPCNAAVTSKAAYQEFEHGIMIWIEAIDMIYVLPNGGDGIPERGWKVQDRWDTSQPEDVPMWTPDGLQRPIRGFGKVWRENPIIRQTMGFATAGEQSYQANWQFTLNWITQRDGVHYLTQMDVFSSFDDWNMQFVSDEVTMDAPVWPMIEGRPPIAIIK